MRIGVVFPQTELGGDVGAVQAAEVDLLTGGKFRLGVGIGWNRVEYQALGQDFSTRGQRLEEQITLLRRLWTEQTVTFSGTFDHLSVNTMGVGLKTVDDHLAALATAAEAASTISS